MIAWVFECDSVCVGTGAYARAFVIENLGGRTMGGTTTHPIGTRKRSAQHHPSRRVTSLGVQRPPAPTGVRSVMP